MDVRVDTLAADSGRITGCRRNSEAVELQSPASYFDVLRTAGIRARSAESASGR